MAAELPGTYEAARAAVAARAVLPASAALALLAASQCGPAVRTALAAAGVLLLLGLALLGERAPRLRSRPRRAARWSAAAAAALVLYGVLAAPGALLLAASAALLLTLQYAVWAPLEPLHAPTALWRRPLAELLRRPELTRGSSERWVEVPWVLERVPAGARVLDLGSAHADPDYHAALAQRGARCCGLDRARAPGRVQVVGDLRALPFADACFDRVIALSTLEHVGCDNRRYGLAREPAEPDGTDPGGDRRALAEIGRVLAPGGRALLTLPYGRAEDHGWFRQYDAARLQNLLSACSGAAQAHYFRYARGWRPAAPGDLAAARYGAGEAPAATGLVCLELSP